MKSNSIIRLAKVFFLIAFMAVSTMPVIAEDSICLLQEDMTDLVKKYCITEDKEIQPLKSASELLSTLEKGKITSSDQFKKAFKSVLATKVRADVTKQNERGFTSEITSYTKVLSEMDSDKITTQVNEHNKSGKLFMDILGPVPETYVKTLELCKKFNPKSKTNDHKKLSKDIDEYLDFMAKTEPVKYALKITETSIDDLRKNWFGAGLGFEHVFAGEVKGSTVSGYHFWYKFYIDERDNAAWYDRTLEGFDDPCIFTGKFSWDPDGNGNKFKKAYKRKGGFVLQTSPEALLALGHIAIEIAKKNNCPSAFKFKASVNDGVYLWQMFTTNRSIRSLYPMVIRSRSIEEEIKEAEETVIDHIIGTEFNDNQEKIAQ